MKQDKKFIKVRDKLAEYISFNKTFGSKNANTYKKLNGSTLNGKINHDLSPKDLQVIDEGITEALHSINQFKKAIETKQK
jgi:surface antigen